MAFSWNEPDILAEYRALIKFEAIARLRCAARERLEKSHWHEVGNALRMLPYFQAVHRDLSNSVVEVGTVNELTVEERARLAECVRLLIPWRKGPFSLFGLELDAEWRSDWKWARVAPHLDTLRGKKIADIGCSTGYYMFRAAAEEPELVVGFEPSERCFYSFDLLQRFVQHPRISFEPYGGEYLSLFPEFFDIVLCMGILYHQKDPLGFLQIMKEGLKPGGQLIVESQAIPGDNDVALFPRERYGKARNVYFVPTVNCLAAWLERAGFVDVEIFSSVVLTTDEQRTTPFAPGESLKDFLSPTDSSQTVEGYPAPLRVAVKARKRVPPFM